MNTQVKPQLKTQPHPTRFSHRTLTIVRSIRALALLLAFLGGGLWIMPRGVLSHGALGDRWDEVENNWVGVWTRRGTSTVFDAVWTNAKGARTSAELTISIQGNSVSVLRRQEGGTCRYQGTLDGTNVTGTYGCDWEMGPFSWRATIGVPPQIIKPHADAALRKGGAGADFPWDREEVPVDPSPTIPPNDEIILYTHGGPGSRLEESLDLAPKLQQWGLKAREVSHSAYAAGGGNAASLCEALMRKG